MDVANKEFVFAGSLDELKAKGRLVLHGGHRPILVIYDRDRVFALDNRCPHMGFPLERGSAAKRSLDCRANLSSGQSASKILAPDVNKRACRSEGWSHARRGAPDRGISPSVRFSAGRARSDVVHRT